MPQSISLNLLAPAAALIVWTLVVMLWMIFIRFTAFKMANIELSKVPPGGRGRDLEKVFPGPANWPSHNYAHLMEQPTIFYPTLVVLALLGQGNTLNLALAWGYVGVRVVHSVWQINVNRVPQRAVLFFVSSLLLVILAVRAVLSALAVA
jgi:hypothetical protein